MAADTTGAPTGPGDGCNAFAATCIGRAAEGTAAAVAIIGVTMHAAVAGCIGGKVGFADKAETTWG